MRLPLIVFHSGFPKTSGVIRAGGFSFVPIAKWRTCRAACLPRRGKGRKKERKMKRDRLFGNALMRLAACVVMAFVCASSAWGKSAIKTESSDRFKEWSKQEVERLKSERESKLTEGKRLRAAASAGIGSETEAEQNRYGVVPSPIDNRYLTRVNKIGARASAVKYPRRYDLREKGFVTTVKDQGNYGTCWAHATMASLESWVLKTEGIEKDYSENNLANLHGFDSAYSQGGNAYKATAYLTRWGGPILEATDPYGRPGQSVSSRPDRHVQKVHIITPKKEGDNTANDEIKRAVMEYGALYVSYWADGWYLGADGRSFNSQASEAEIWFYENVYNVHYWHAVALVGWDDDYPKENFADSDYDIPPAEGNGAYIIKNSWGAVTYDDSGKAYPVGDEGYYYVSYYDTQLARDEIFAFASAESANNYEKVYEYDPLGYSGSLYGFESCKGWGANVFTATGDDTLSAIGFYARTPNASYSICVYTNVAANASPTSGQLAATVSGVTDSNTAGYFTIPLGSENEVCVNAGERFSIVMEIKTPDSRFPIPMEYVYFDTDENGQEYETYNSAVTASTGQSFFSEDGRTWYDLNFTRVNYSDGTSEFLGKYRPNICFKAYTKSRQAPSPTLTKVEIVGDSATIASGKTATFRCKATYSDGPADYVCGEWSVSPEGVVALSTTGNDCIVTAGNFTESCVIALTVAYTENGVSKSDTWNNVTITVEPPPTPVGVAATQGVYTDGVSVNWSIVEGAGEYVVSRGGEQAFEGRNAAHIARVSKPPYMDSSPELIAGKTYSYFVQAINESGKSDYSCPRAEGWMRLSKPTGLLATDTLIDRIHVTWSAVDGATHYRVYRAESIDGEKSAISDWQTATTFDDTGATPGATYFYFIAAAVDANGNRPSDYSIVEDGMKAVPVTIDYLEIKGEASIASGGHADYTVDAIYTDGHKVENVTPNNWEIVGEGASVAGGRVTAAVVAENKSIVLKAVYTEGGKTATGEKAITIAAAKPAAPRNVTATATAQGVVLAWDAVADAASYSIYRNGDAVGRVATSAPGGNAPTVYTDVSAIPGVTYAYTVSAANGAGEGPQSSPAVAATIPLSAPTGVAATTDRTDGVLVDWRRVMDNAPRGQSAVYFRVARATSADGAKTELVSWMTDMSFLDTSAPVDTPLWYFVRAATDSSGANASGWSAGVVGRVVPNAPQLLSIVISGPDKVASSGSAVYSCTAKYSDGTSKSVSPVWSASGAAAIDANGKLTAHAVTADADVAVTAAFGGKSASKEVKVLAPVQASASVSNVRVKPRWPFSTLVDIDYTLSTAPEGTRALVTLSGQDNDHDVPMAAKTLTGDAVGAAVAAGEHRLTWDIGADYPGFHAASFDVKFEAVPYTIAAPANIRHSTSSYCEESLSSTGVVKVVWHVRHSLAWDAAEGAASYKVFRNTANDLSSATLLATVTGTSYGFDGTDKEPAYYYWVVAVKGASSAASDVFAVAATTVDLMPLRNLLTTMESINPDGVLADNEINKAISNPRYSDMDGNKTVNSPEELYVFTRIKALNADKQLISDVMRGDYTNIDGSTLMELFELSECCRDLRGGNYSSVVLFPKRPSNVSATQQNYSTAKIIVSWAEISDVQGYEVWRSATKDFSSGVTKVADVTTTSYTDTNVSFRGAYSYMILAKYADGSRLFSPIYVYGYWGDWCLAEVWRDLLPLRNLLNIMERASGIRDGVLSDLELTRAMKNASLADMDGDPKNVSAAELAIFNRIEVLNKDKDMISSVIRGDYTYRNMTRAQMVELQSLSDTVKELSKKKNG